MSTPSRIPTISFPSTRAPVSTEETSGGSTFEPDATQGYPPETFSDGFETGRPVTKSARRPDLSGAMNNPDSALKTQTSGVNFPRGHTNESTVVNAARKALSQHLETDLKDLPDTEKQNLRTAIQDWTPTGPLVEDDYGYQRYQSNLAGHNSDVIFDPQLKTAFALIDK
ncbi:MAG: hypothetical protein ACT4TC_21160 [Myxococcaceae bacterium]